MKRLCILLAALLVLPLCACTAPEADPSADGSSAVPSAPPSESSGSDAVCEAALEIDALLAGGASDRTQVRKNVLAGKTYTLSRPAGSGDDYADPDGKKLTDGAYAEQFNTYSWTGFAGGTPVAVDFDLGDDAHGISDIEIGCLRQMEYGIGARRLGHALRLGRRRKLYLARRGVYACVAAGPRQIHLCLPSG